jgi:hypothetical protein
MSKLKLFFVSLYQSATNPGYYADVVKAPLSFSVRYILFLSFVLSLIGTIVTSVTMIPALKSVSNEIDKRAATLFPPNLIISIKNGQLATNQKTPLTLTLPSTDGGPNTIVIDPEAKEKDIDKNKVFILANKDGVLFNSDTESRTYSYKDMEIKDVRIDRKMFDEIVKKGKDYLKIVPTILPAIIFIGLSATTVISVFFKALFYTLITSIVLKLSSLKIGVKKSFQITLHAITPILLLQILEILFGFIVPIPLFYPILFAILIVIIARELKKEPPVNEIKAIAPKKKASRPKKKIVV